MATERNIIRKLVVTAGAGLIATAAALPAMAQTTVTRDIARDAADARIDARADARVDAARDARAASRDVNTDIRREEVGDARDNIRDSRAAVRDTTRDLRTSGAAPRPLARAAAAAANANVRVNANTGAGARVDVGGAGYRSNSINVAPTRAGYRPNVAPRADVRVNGATGNVRVNTASPAVGPAPRGVQINAPGVNVDLNAPAGVRITP